MSGKLKKLLEEARHGMFFTAVGKNHWQWGCRRCETKGPRKRDLWDCMDSGASHERMCR
jgi:hypothetical protein